jgi:hypothetical protein
MEQAFGPSTEDILVSDHAVKLSPQWIDAQEQSQISIGLELDTIPNLNDTIKRVQNDQFGFIALPLADSKQKKNLIAAGVIENNAKEMSNSSDILLSAAQWSSWIVGKVSTSIDMDSTNELIRKESKKVI